MKSTLLFAFVLLFIYCCLATTVSASDLEKTLLAEMNQEIADGVNVQRAVSSKFPMWLDNFVASLEDKIEGLEKKLCSCLNCQNGAVCEHRTVCQREQGMGHGNCEHDSVCKCKPGFHGPRCEKGVTDVNVTCSLTVDNKIDGVYYNGKPLNPSGNLGVWTEEKKIRFTVDSKQNGCGDLRIDGTDLNATGHCTWGGLILHCTASDQNSSWHNFKSDTEHWKVQDGSRLCSDNKGMIPPGQRYAFMKALIRSGAKKIWADKKTVSLIGRPC